MTAEVLVIGGGPAGLAAAIAAAQRGFSVSVAEPRPGAIDKCCGEGLLPAAVAALAQLGIAPSTLLTHGVQLRGICFHHEGLRSASGAFRTPGIGLRRTVLHQLLRERAQALGVCFLPHSARLLRDGVVRMDGSTVSPRWILACDGTQSLIRRDAGLDRPRISSRRFAIRQHFARPPGSTEQPAVDVDVYWTPGAQAYVTPIDDASVGIAIVATRKLRSFREEVKRFPALMSLLECGDPRSVPRGAVTVHQRFARVTTAHLALVGDASGSVDAITGDGLSLAFCEALAASEALAAEDLSRYEQAHSRLNRRARAMSRALLCMGSHHAITEASMQVLGRVPGLFPRLLRLHTGGHLSEEDVQYRETPWPAAPISERSAT